MSRDNTNKGGYVVFEPIPGYVWAFYLLIVAVIGWALIEGLIWFFNHLRWS